MKTDIHDMQLLQAENAALWKVVNALQREIRAENKLFEKFRPSLVMDLSRKEWKRVKPLYSALCDQHEAAERDLNAALDALEKFEKGDVA